MFDIWLNESTKMVLQIIDESNLKEVTKRTIEDYMNTESFANELKRIIEQQIKNNIEDYAEFYLLSDDGWNSVEKKIKEIIVDEAEKRGENHG